MAGLPGTERKQLIGMVVLRACSALIFTLLVACGGERAAQEPADTLETVTETGSEDVVAEDAPPEFENYIECGDLDAIGERGTLRLLAPRGLEEEALPRDGLPTGEWRALAEKFAHKRGLEPQWVYVDNFAQLIPALIEGRGDLIAVNFSRTQERAMQVAFTRPLEYVQEQLITRRDLDASDGSLDVVLRKGSAFAQTLKQQSTESRSFHPRYLEGPVTQDELLDGVTKGEFDATVIDSNLAEVLLPDYPKLRAEDLRDSRRAIAWAVRRDSKKLERALNEYFTEEHLIAARRRASALRDWEQIQETRTLRVLTRNHPASYFMWRGELMGFDYDLLQRFARDHGLRLSMVVPGPDVDLADALAAGHGDLIAASLTVTESRKAQGLVFTRPYMQVTEQLVTAADNMPETVSAVPVAQRLQGQSVAVNPLSSYYTSLVALADAAESSVDVLPVGGATTEQLIDAVAAGRYDYTVADSHLVEIEQTYRDDFAVVGDISGERDIAWAVRGDQPVLLKELNDFLNKYYRGLFFNVTYNKYFREEKRLKKKQRERLRDTSALSPYDPIVRKHAVPAGRDWRMVVSQMYQESRFNPKAKSFAGARGLMQVMPRTARQMGISGLYQPENGIRAGVEYMGWLEERFPKTLPFDQKIYFTLAAYNAGHGHVRDARVLAEQMGKDPNRWFNNVEDAMLLLAKPQYYKKARFGYVRGREPVNYVREIRDRYFGYLSVARNEQMSEQQ
ncbi:transporter substrate-binding domain-containing protein [Microbulbifer hydrolyticus]|uniref:Membrane-bound lytic murein transglycosylase F n=1 Tax=Microbulbifer hydrolyticus TaxID=48074 RepID=A0A6P1T5J9_9GAMM|nr:transporter substrate-binding domain-containing protein [Microbulbifer hydrolyticus]MBB5211233.1 membrane-bound lytic murein transglycosylase F [Microbulbifer hydrolyticus]QHQ37998.1 transporter substrate-binding domain-containing protein [Microbulbifer hydrolyticus]